MFQFSTLQEAHAIYRSHGYVVFETGVVNPWVLELIAEHLGAIRGIWGKNYELGHKPYSETSTNSVAQSLSELPPHTDGTFEIDLPPSLILQCVVPDKDGFGISTLIDCWKVIELLSTQTKHTLLKTPFRFFREEMGKQVTLMAPILELQDSVYKVRYRNDHKHPLIPPTGEARVALTDFIDGISKPSVMTEIQLKAGDVIWIDNHRFLHGRTGLSNQIQRKVRRYWIQFKDALVF